MAGAGGWGHPALPAAPALLGNRVSLALAALGCWTPMSPGPKEPMGSHVRALAPSFLGGGEGLPAAAGGKAADKCKHTRACGRAAVPPHPPEHERSNTSIYCHHPAAAGRLCTGEGFATREVKGSAVVSHGQDGGTSIGVRMTPPARRCRGMPRFHLVPSLPWYRGDLVQDPRREPP